MKDINPWPWLALFAVSGIIAWFVVRSTVLAVKLGFPGWLLDVATVSILLGVPVAAIFKVFLFGRKNNG